MSVLSEKSIKDTYSFNLNDIIQDSFESSSITNSYNKITPKYNKENNLFRRKQSALKYLRKYKNYSKEILCNSKSTSQSEENKTKFFFKENKENQVSLFTNSLIREKEKKYRLNSCKSKKYDLYLKCNIQNKAYHKIVNSKKELFNSLLSQTNSNFNNKYNILYAVPNFNQKLKIKKLFDSIKKYQNKFNFSDYLEKGINNRCLSSKIIKENNRLNLSKINNGNDLSQILLHNKQSDYLKNIFHKNNLIKIKTF